MRPKITQLTPMKPDLHTHTTASDGLLTPAELVALADKHRVTLLAVTDHDTFDGAAQLLGKPAPMPILQGVELSLRDMPGLHLLGYGRGTDTPLHRKVRALSQMRLGRARQMVEKLNALGYPLDYDEIAREAKGSVGRPHIARAMVSRGYVVDMFDLTLFSYPVFNFADCCVVVGAILGAVYYLFFYDKYGKRERPHGNDTPDGDK